MVSFYYFLPLIMWLILIGFGLVASFLIFRWCVSFSLFQFIRTNNLIPKISSTEKSALLAGSSWIEKEFFTGHPDFKKIFNQPFPRLTEEEKSFLNNETEELCGMSGEWDLIKRRRMSEKTEEFLKKEKFFGMVIPKSYGGKGFSPFAHAKVIEKISTHNTPLSVIAMVPNSLGPAELLLKYGTEEQKDKYLSKLAKGEDIPCFGLTEPQAGSDVSSLQSTGTLFKEKGHLKIRINCDKRWITLSSKATLIGLAVRLKDPDKLLSEKEDLGITCLLISGDSPGLERGLHHDPMGIPIYNAPLKGRDIIVFAEESIIGGLKNAGKGWSMLMECLSMGRGISLPSLSVGFGKKIAWLTGTHALVRKQFGLSIYKFEGVEEVLAKIAGLTHLVSTAQTFTLSGFNQGIYSPVVSAFTKYALTEIVHKVVKGGMDIMGGAGLSLGPKNKMAQMHIIAPLAVTVEGANILTRTFIVYGQGLIKTHPHAYPMICALEQKDFKVFHKKLWSFLYQLIINFFRSFVCSLTRGWLFVYPKFFSKEHRYLQKIEWSSSLFAFLSDLSLAIFGGRLKTKGKLTGRFADLLSYQYIATALIWNLKHTERSKASWIKTKWGLEYCFWKIQESFSTILMNYPHPVINIMLKPFLFLLKINPIGRPPSDKLGRELAVLLIEDEEFRKELCHNMYLPKDSEDQFQKLNKAYKLSLQENHIWKKIKKKTQKKLSAEQALKQQLISPEEYKVLESAKKAQWSAIQVDAFTKEEYFGDQRGI